GAFRGSGPDGHRVAQADVEGRDLTHHVDDQADGRRLGPDVDRGREGGAARGTHARFYCVPAGVEITIRDLLTHASGLVSGGISNQEARSVALKGKETLADYLPRLGKVPLDFQPGTRWAYSARAGFDVLSRVVEMTSAETS